MEKLLKRKRTKVTVDGWLGGWPGNVTRSVATPEDTARLERINEASMVQQRKDMLLLEEIYPSADGETLALTSD